MSMIAGKRVLICDDEGLILAFLLKVLTTVGLNVVGMATTGEECIDLARRESPDIIIIDHNMPPGMSGTEAARQILAERDTCVIMLSASPEVEREAYDAGITVCIKKPTDAVTLVCAIRDAYAHQIQRLLAAA